jgi:hypothetical protein
MKWNSPIFTICFLKWTATKNKCKGEIYNMEMDPGVLMSLLNQEENTGFEFIWVLLIFLIFGFGNGGGLMGGGSNIETAVQAANASQTQGQMLFSSIQGLGSGLADIGYEMGMNNGATNRNIDALRYDVAREICGLSHAMSDGFCNLNFNQERGFQSIINYLAEQETDRLRTELTQAQMQLSQLSQTQSIINGINNSTSSYSSSYYPSLV